jgi:hypothetical protein
MHGVVHFIAPLIASVMVQGLRYNRPTKAKHDFFSADFLCKSIGLLAVNLSW